MPKEIDKRNLNAFAGFEGAKADVNPWTGNLLTLAMDKPMLFEGKLMDKAISFLRSREESFGFENTSAGQFLTDPNISETSTGEKTVHVQQLYKSVPIFLVNKAIIFNKEGGIETTVGDTVNITEDISIEPKVNSIQAVEVAVQAILSDEEDVDESTDGWGEFVARKLVEFTDLPPKPTVFDKSMFSEEIRANLVVFYIGPEAMLSWYFTITVTELGPQYDLVIAADNPSNIEVLYLKRTSQHAAAKGNIHKVNGGDPRVLIDFPLPSNSYLLPASGNIVSFKEWVHKDETRGVNVIVQPADNTISFRGMLNGSTVMFEPRQPKRTATAEW
jgi:hypothetical protein